MGEFCDWQKRTPVVLASMNKLVKVSFNPLIHMLCLSISTRVEGCTEVLLCACGFADRSTEMASESGILIRDDPLRDSKPGKKVIKIKLCYVLIIYGLVAGQEFSSFGTSLVHNGEDSVIGV